MDRALVEAAIRSAFAGVSLGSGVSLRQAAAMDRYMEDVTQAEFDALPRAEVTEDWTRIPDEELSRDELAFLDPQGLRYYLPAYLLWLLEHHDGAGDQSGDETDRTVIAVISELTPTRALTRRYQDYEIFSREQMAAIALYVRSLPDLVHLNDEDAADLRVAYDHFWHRYEAGA